MILSWIKNNNLLLIALLAAFVLRIIFLEEKLFFGFEQGRDLIAVSKIINLQDLRLVGANTDIDGIFHGVLYYYFLSPLFVFFKGDPYGIQVSLIVLNVLSILFIYRSASILFNRTTAIYSSFAFALSYSAIIYSRWQSNPNPILFLSAVLFYSLVKTREDRKYLILTSLCWAFIFHCSLATAATLVFPIILFLHIYKVKLNITHVFLSIAVILIILSPYLVFEYKNNYLLFKSIIKYATSMGTHTKTYFGAFNQFTNELVDNIFPARRTLGLLVSLIILIWISFQKEKRIEIIVVLSFILLPVLFFTILGIYPLRHVFIALPMFLSILIGHWITLTIKSKYRYLGRVILITFFVVNSIHMYSSLSSGKNNFLQQSQRTYLGDQKKVLDYVYSEAKGNPFSYEYFSVPWWRDEAWEYLFSWYGKNKYNYLPNEQEKSQVFYAIWEPDETKPIYKDNWYGELNKVSNIIEIKKYGELGAEKREWKQK